MIVQYTGSPEVFQGKLKKFEFDLATMNVTVEDPDGYAICARPGDYVLIIDEEHASVASARDYETGKAWGKLKDRKEENPAEGKTERFRQREEEADRNDRVNGQCGFCYWHHEMGRPPFITAYVKIYHLRFCPVCGKEI